MKKYVQYFIKALLRVYWRIFGKVAGLEEVLDYCSKNTRFYNGLGTDISTYPIIDKKMVMADPDSFQNKQIYFTHTGVTSGTSGTPGKYLRDFRSIAAEQYYQDRYFGWKGKYMVVMRGEMLFKAGEDAGCFYKAVPGIKGAGCFYKADPGIKGAGCFYKTVPGIREMYVSSYHLNDMNLGVLFDKLVKIPGKCLWAYPSTAYLLADYCRRRHKKLAFDIVALSSERLLDYQKAIIESIFNCRILDWYGQAERAAALYLCTNGSYHEVPGYSHVEYIALEKNLYELAGTTFYNRAMPLIRFRTGDIVELSDGFCACGAKTPNIKAIQGRVDDFLDLPVGRVSGTLLTMPFKKARNIIESQVMQKKDGNIVIRVVRDRDYCIEDEQLLIQGLQSYLPKELFTLEYVDSIEKGPNGKFRFVINERLQGNSHWTVN